MIFSGKMHNIQYSNSNYGNNRNNKRWSFHPIFILTLNNDKDNSFPLMQNSKSIFFAFSAVSFMHKIPAENHLSPLINIIKKNYHKVVLLPRVQRA